jgi:DNA (cytosine-5)-methyltransferase 1
VSEQKRASPWHVVDWIQKTRPEAVLIENVPELKSWGPIEDGQPTRNGETFEAWVDAIHSLGYSVDWDTLNAADYGDATTRRRLFVVGRRGQRASFPEPTHSDDNAELLDHRPAAEIIDWSDPGSSIWIRSRPLSNNTMQRIAEGVRQHCDDDLAGYADILKDISPEDVDRLQEDIVAAENVAEAAAEREEPFLVAGPAVGDGAGGTSMVMGQQSGARALDAEQEPVPTIATKGAVHCIHCDPFVLPRNLPARGLHSNETYEPSERPLHTVTAKNHDGHLIRPFLVPYKSEREGQRPRVHDVQEPYPTVTATGSDPYLCRPFLVEYYGNSDTADVDTPLPTVTTKDRHALCVPDLYPWGLDLRYRMLQPRELAAAQGFPSDYEFAGNKGETTEQIGNAVPVHLAKALVTEALTGQKPSLHSYSPDTASQVDADD